MIPQDDYFNLSQQSPDFNSYLLETLALAFDPYNAHSKPQRNPNPQRNPDTHDSIKTKIKKSFSTY